MYAHVHRHTQNTHERPLTYNQQRLCRQKLSPCAVWHVYCAPIVWSHWLHDPDCNPWPSASSSSVYLSLCLGVCRADWQTPPHLLLFLLPFPVLPSCDASLMWLPVTFLLFSFFMLRFSSFIHSSLCTSICFCNYNSIHAGVHLPSAV